MSLSSLFSFYFLSSILQLCFGFDVAIVYLLLCFACAATSILHIVFSPFSCCFVLFVLCCAVLFC